MSLPTTSALLIPTLCHQTAWQKLSARHTNGREQRRALANQTMQQTTAGKQDSRSSIFHVAAAACIMGMVGTESTADTFNVIAEAQRRQILSLLSHGGR